MDAAERNRKGDREIMALTEEEVRRMENQADLSDRFNKAADNFVVGNYPRLRAAEREQVLREREGDVFAAARNRRLNSVMDIALRDPGRYAPSVHRAAVEWDRQNQAAGLRNHELAMLKQQGENEFKVAEQKRFGMREQGADAAGVNAKATEYGWDKQLEMENKRQSGLTEREKMIGDRTERIAGMEHGTIGPDGKVTPGSRERVATITGQSAVQQQAEANKGLAAQAEINRQKQQEKLDADLRRTIINANSKLGAAEIKAHSDKIKSAIEAGKWNGKDPAMVLAEMAEAQKDNPDMLRSISAAATIYGVQMDGGQQQPTTGGGGAPNIPGYSPEKVAELQKRGYKWNGTNWVK